MIKFNYQFIVLLVAWTTIVLFTSVSMTASSPELEAKALLQSGWWPYSEDDGDHCDWPGIACNYEGSVTDICLARACENELSSKMKRDFSKLNFSSFPNLARLKLADASLFGSIPAEIGTLSKLIHVDLSFNGLTGQLPPSLANLSQLVVLDLYYNKLNGSVPQQLTSLRNLIALNMSSNSFTGPIPPDIGLLINLTHLHLSSNQIEGHLPLSLSRLANLVILDAASNKISGSFPDQIGNLKNLVSLDLSHNMLNAPLPSTLDQLNKLAYLSLSFNKINGSIISTLDQLTNLVELHLESNQIGNSLPPKIGNLKNLSLLSLGDNLFSGSLPPEIGNLKNLSVLSLNRNMFNGFIPLEIGNLENLTVLDLSVNTFQGSLPPTFGQLANLRELRISSNEISGSIPLEIGNLKNLTHLDLSFNKLLGPIFPSLNGLEDNLAYLYLGSNRIKGSIDPNIGNLKELRELDLSLNELSGIVPKQIAQLKGLQHLNLSWNNLKCLPIEICDCEGLNVLDISHNLIRADLPPIQGNWLACNYIAKIIQAHPPCYSFLDEPFDGIKDLYCDTGVLACANGPKRKRVDYKIILPVIIFSVALIFSASILLVYKCRLGNRNGEPDNGATKEGDTFLIWNCDEKIAYEDIIRATEDFDTRYCIGRGGHASVYKAQLPSGKVVAVKKFHASEVEGVASPRSFATEVKTLTEIRHRNIARLYGFCLYKRCMFLVSKYMERGSLFSVLRDDAEAVQLDWSKRVNIIKGTAHALSYLHHDCGWPIVHRDLTSTNILLNSELEACVSDFGTAKLLDPDSSNQTMFAGTLGYIAPDDRLSPPRNRVVAGEVVLVASLAFACINAKPKCRPTMKQVSQHSIACKGLLARSFSKISLGQLMIPEAFLDGESEIGTCNRN
ncbi:hypothetical protein TIFTF001_011565 [Ficus carica]|uniref:non-specific serine/threonine protein kinase n=1 Tax=Ficus carica TaxID=3494 RepID=A0AA88A041_FICCA|nr:hypothetical protein TIFTF001_011565 [Ficus carica]